jgi:hypothetical protein
VSAEQLRVQQVGDQDRFEPESTFGPLNCHAIRVVFAPRPHGKGIAADFGGPNLQKRRTTMKSKITGHIAKIGLFATVMLATRMFAGPANAQSNITGKFTLPYEARWGQAVLPPGEYQLTFVDNNAGTMLLIRDAKSLRVVAYEPVNNPEDNTKSTSALLVGTRGTERVVESLRIAELGETFVYQRSSAHGRKAEEARQLQTVPVLAAEKQP